MTTSTDIVNRALQMLGSRTTVASLAEQSNEAIQANLVYSIVTDWAHAATNWNFARRLATGLTVVRQISGPPPFQSLGYPQPPWQWGYALPTDFIRAIYLTDVSQTVPASPNSTYVGEPQRYVLSKNVVAGTESLILLTNVAAPGLVYTARTTDPTIWPALFERFAVAALAHALVYQLTGDRSLVDRMEAKMMSFFAIAEQQNRLEELMPSDATPEWIQAIGMDYPFRRRLVGQPEQQREQQRDNRR